MRQVIIHRYSLPSRPCLFTFISAFSWASKRIWPQASCDDNSDALAKELRERFQGFNVCAENLERGKNRHCQNNAVAHNQPRKKVRSSCVAFLRRKHLLMTRREGLFCATLRRDYIFRGLARPRRLRRASRGAKFLS
jgi:hypothetical protein